MKTIITLSFYFLLFTFNSLLAQTSPFAQNLWASVLWRHQFNRGIVLTSDVGYRSFDAFYKQTRQQLGRVMIEKKIGANHAFGIGYTYFNSYSSSNKKLTGESRPFINYQFIQNLEKFALGLRIRNELRYFIEKKEWINRLRGQINFEFKTTNKNVLPRIFVEGFISSGTNTLKEYRFSIGNTFTISDTYKFFIFYTLQRQSSLVVNNNVINQHILGLQVQLNTTSNVKE